MIFSSRLGEIGGQTALKKISDAKPELMSKKGGANFWRFYPAGTSYNCILHFTQLMKSKEFKRFDMGSEDLNMKRYGQVKPPLYNLDEIKGFNISLICGSGDLLASPPDYNWLHT